MAGLCGSELEGIRVRRFGLVCSFDRAGLLDLANVGLASVGLARIMVLSAAASRAVVDLEGGSGFGQVEAFGGGLDGADHVGGVGAEVEVGGVDGGELEAVEEGGGAAGVELAGSECVDDDGEGDLDGLAVFERGEFDVLAGDEGGAGLPAIGASWRKPVWRR